MKSNRHSIAVSQRVVEVHSYGEVRDCLDQEWAKWLGLLGFNCVPVPNTLSSVEEFLVSVRPVGILLTGGNNLSLPVYDGISDCAAIADVSGDRDSTERQLIEYSISHSLPLLGCCRGMQMLHCHFGGRLRKLESGQVSHVGTEHAVQLIGAPMREAAGMDTLCVNSYHDFGFDSDALTPELVPFGVSQEDGIVEGLRHRTLPMAGIMWHPERDNPAHEFDQVIATDLFTGRGQIFGTTKPTSD